MYLRKFKTFERYKKNRSRNAEYVDRVLRGKFLRHRLYGASSEQVAAQGYWFDEVEALLPWNFTASAASTKSASAQEQP